MSEQPKPKFVQCTECGTSAVAVIPPGEIVEREEDSDGKVWVHCHECGAEFLAYYRKET